MTPRIAIPVPTSTDLSYNQRSWPSYATAVTRSGGEPVAIELGASPAEIHALAGKLRRHPAARKPGGRRSRTVWGGARSSLGTCGSGARGAGLPAARPRGEVRQAGAGHLLWRAVAECMARRLADPGPDAASGEPQRGQQGSDRAHGRRCARTASLPRC